MSPRPGIGEEEARYLARLTEPYKIPGANPLEVQCWLEKLREGSLPRYPIGPAGEKATELYLAEHRELEVYAAAVRSGKKPSPPKCARHYTSKRLAEMFPGSPFEETKP